MTVAFVAATVAMSRMMTKKKKNVTHRETGSRSGAPVSTTESGRIDRPSSEQIRTGKPKWFGKEFGGHDSPERLFPSVHENPHFFGDTGHRSHIWTNAKENQRHADESRR